MRESTSFFLNQAYCMNQGVKDLAEKRDHHIDLLEAKFDYVLASSAFTARRTSGMWDGVHS